MMKKATAFLAVLCLLAACCSASADGLPSRYDMRNDGIVTPVKLQYPWGSCWAFSTIAAAETSILSAMGRTYDEFPLDLSELHAAWFAKRPITAADDPVQAGEGNRLEQYKDPQMGEQMRLSSGSSYLVTGLFSTGAGPVEESRVPYHGREKTPEPWVVLHEPDKWIENYLRMNADKVISEEELQVLRESVPAELLPEEAYTEDQLRLDAKKELEKKRAEVATGFYLLWYSGDDWRLPDTDRNGKSFRMQRSSWLLKDSNRLPEPLVHSDPDHPDSVRVPNESGMTAMKREMLNGHPVVVAYHAEKYSPAGGNPNLYTNYETWAQYTYDAEGTNHVVCIVGWDDDYPAENFTHDVYTEDERGKKTLDAERTAKTTPPGNGAWLIKNSRGSETDAVPGGMEAPDGEAWPEHRSNYGIVNEKGLHTGYNWVSYYDQTLRAPETLAFTAEEGDPSGILQYDYMIGSPDDHYEKKCEQPVSAANVFTAERDMDLTAVSTRTFHADSRVVFTIVKMGENAENPEDGETIARFSGTFRYAGYHRAELAKPLTLKKGDRFSVITTTSRLGSDGKRTWLYAANRANEFRMCIVVNPGESFVKEGGKWQDWTETKKYKDPQDPASGEDATSACDNFSIKAFFR